MTSSARKTVMRVNSNRPNKAAAVGGPGGITDNLRKTRDIVSKVADDAHNSYSVTAGGASWSTKDLYRLKNAGIDFNLNQSNKGAIRVVYQMTRKKLRDIGGFHSVPEGARLKTIATMVQEAMREALGQKRCLGAFLKYAEEQKFLKWTDDQVIPPLETGNWRELDGKLIQMDQSLREDPNLNSKDMFFLRKRVDRLRWHLNSFQIARAKAESQVAKLVRLQNDPNHTVDTLEEEFQLCAKIAEEVHEQVLGFTSELRKFGWGRVPACPDGHGLLHHKVTPEDFQDNNTVPGTTSKCRKTAVDKAGAKTMETVKGFLEAADRSVRMSHSGGPQMITSRNAGRGSKFGAAVNQIGQRISYAKTQTSYFSKFAKGASYETTQASSSMGLSKRAAQKKAPMVCNACNQKFQVNWTVWKCQKCNPYAFFCTNCKKGTALYLISSLSGQGQHDHELAWTTAVQELLDEPCDGWTGAVRDLHATLLRKKGGKKNE